MTALEKARAGRTAQGLQKRRDLGDAWAISQQGPLQRVHPVDGGQGRGDDPGRKTRAGLGGGAEGEVRKIRRAQNFNLATLNHPAILWYTNGTQRHGEMSGATRFWIATPHTRTAGETSRRAPRLSDRRALPKGRGIAWGLTIFDRRASYLTARVTLG